MKEVIIFFVALVIGVAWANATQPTTHTKCDEVIVYTDGGKVCEVFLNKHANPEQVQRNGFTKADRI